MDVLIGGVLTVNREIISLSGRIIFELGDKVKVDETEKKGAFWGKMSGTYYPEEITGIKIYNVYGFWPLELFKETSKHTLITRDILIEKIVLKKQHG
jgi:hypothetical protein